MGITTTVTIMTTTDAALYRLMTWLSPAYPLGAFSYSHGLEYAVEEGLIKDAASLAAWVATIVEDGAGRIDAAFFARASTQAAVGDDAALDETAALAAAWRGTAEMALESAAQGAAFLAITRAAWPEPRLEALAARHDGKLPLAVAVGAACAFYAIPLVPSLLAYLQAFAANLVSAGVRLVPLGQTDGQRVVAALEPVVARTAAAAPDTDPETLGTSAMLVDWCSMKHETQYTRLFRS